MEIDIKPVVEEGSVLEKLYMEAYDLKNLYVFKYENGNRLSTTFTPEELLNFTSKTVSEQLINWEEGITRQIEKWETAIKTKKHPVHTVHKRDKGGELIRDKKGRLIAIPTPLDESNINSINTILERLRSQQGKISFVKLV